ncbi:hypothetical protein [Rhodococcus triatomae]
MTLLTTETVRFPRSRFARARRRVAVVAAGICAACVLSPLGASAAAGDAYVSNPPEDRDLIGYCQDQARLANNLVEKGDSDRAVDVVGAANIRGCRIYTFGMT